MTRTLSVSRLSAAAGLFAALLPLSLPAAPPKNALPSIAWQFDTHGDKELAPRTNIFLRVGSRRILVLRNAEEQFQIMRRQDYRERMVPSEAIIACAGWWAGAGDDLYVVRRGKSLVVFRREEDEQAPVFPWQRLKVIPLRE